VRAGDRGNEVDKGILASMSYYIPGEFGDFDPIPMIPPTPEVMNHDVRGEGDHEQLFAFNIRFQEKLIETCNNELATVRVDLTNTEQGEAEFCHTLSNLEVVG
jgi:hypothetical protein